MSSHCILLDMIKWIGGGSRISSENIDHIVGIPLFPHSWAEYFRLLQALNCPCKSLSALGLLSSSETIAATQSASLGISHR